MSLAVYPFEMLHNCGKPALRMAHEPVAGVMLRELGLCRLDGSLIYRGERLVCGSCGVDLTPFDFNADSVFRRAANEPEQQQ